MDWLETNGKEPGNWNKPEYIWIYSRSLGAELIQTDCHVIWSYYSHWMPADIITPNSPVKGG